MECRVLKTCQCEVSQKYKGSKHNGIDLVGAGYTLDYAVALEDGTVVGLVNNINYNTSKSGQRIYGNYVLIKHDNGMRTLYAHLKYGTVAVALNQRVVAGALLGYMGNTGYSFGAHLHFEVRNENNVKIDPTPYVAGAFPVKEEKQETTKIESNTIYIVKKGDTLSKIASMFGTTYQELAKINGIENPDIIYEGQVIRINSVGTYTVQKGDNLSNIASRYNTTWQKLYENNKDIIGDNPNLIKDGQTLKI